MIENNTTSDKNARFRVHRPGTTILGIQDGESAESGIHLSRNTRETHPEIWKRVPVGMRDVLNTGLIDIFVDTVGNMAFQKTYEIPKVQSNIVAFPAQEDVVEARAAD